jgi:hypothetical protein
VSRKLPLSCDFGSEVLWRGPLPTRRLGGGPIFCRIGFTPTGMPRPCTHSRTNLLTGLPCVGGPTDGIFREVSQYARDIAVFEDKEGVYFITEDVGPAYGNSTVYVDTCVQIFDSNGTLVQRTKWGTSHPTFEDQLPLSDDEIGSSYILGTMSSRRFPFAH